jgi:TRAP-type transport system periplasmic protein
MDSPRPRRRLVAAPRPLARLALVALAALALVAGRDAGAADKTFRLAHAFNEQTAYHKGALEFQRALERLSNGQLHVDLFPNGQLGNDRAQSEGLQLGTLDFTTLGTATLAGTAPLLQVADLPFIFTDFQHVDRVFAGPIGEEFANLFNGTGIKLLSYWEIGFRHITNSRRPIRVPDDVKGLKLRTLPNPIHQQAWRLAGALPTPMDFQEVYSGLQQNVIDAEENPLNVIGTAKFYEVQKYVSLTSHVYTASPFLVSAITWSKLSAAEQKAVQEAAKLAGVVARQAARDQDDQWLKTLESKGMQIERNPDREKFAALMTPVWAEYAKKYGAPGARLLDLLRASRQ